MRGLRRPRPEVGTGTLSDAKCSDDLAQETLRARRIGYRRRDPADGPKAVVTNFVAQFSLGAGIERLASADQGIPYQLQVRRQTG